MARQFHVPGTQTYFIMSLILLGLGIWCLKDGWFPSAAVLAKHAVWDEAGRLDHFYSFNRSLSVLALIGSAVCAYIHRVVR